MVKKIRISEVVSEAARRFKVQTADLSEQKDIIEFFKLAYSDQFNAFAYQDDKKVIERWRWANFNNPNIYDSQFPAWFCLDNDSNKIVGHVGIMPTAFKYKDNSYLAVWARDFIVPARFRRLGIGSLLFDSALRKTKDKAAIFLLAGLNDYAVSIYKKLGFIHLGYIPRYIRINRFDNILKAMLRGKIIISCLKIIGEIFLEIAYSISALVGKFKNGSTRKIIISEINSFDASFDKLWEEIAPSFPIIARRDCTNLNWRFVHQPYWKYRIFIAKNEESQKLEGYIVLRGEKSRGLRVGIISDLFAKPDDTYTISRLIDFSIEYFNKKDKTDLIRCDILHKDFARILKKFGFIGIRSHSHFMVTNINQNFEREFILNRDNWFINSADCDLDLSSRE